MAIQLNKTLDPRESDNKPVKQCNSIAQLDARDFRPQIERLPIKDSGQRRDFDTGSRRDVRDGKGRFDLLPCLAMRRLAQHFEKGANKYAARNWEKGQPLSVYMDSALRHAFAFLGGQRDEDHLIAAVWNLMCLAETEMRIRHGRLPGGLDDLPPAVLAPPEPTYCGRIVAKTAPPGTCCPEGEKGPVGPPGNYGLEQECCQSEEVVRAFV